MRGIFSRLAIVWRIASPYFRSQDRWPGRLLLAAVIAIELSIVGITVLLNEWNARFYNALQDRNWNAFVYQLGYFCVLAAAFILLAVYQLYLNQWLQIRWRRWLTSSYLDHWMEGANHYRMQLLGDAADNPDQRISEDIAQFIQLTLGIGLQLLNSCVTLFSFMIILWSLSAAAPLHLFGMSFNIPGYLLWAALIYACIGTALTHLIGRPLIALNFQQQRYEADFRFNLVRVRENSEQIALLDGERAERDRLLMRFGNVVANWLAIMSRQKKLTFFTASYAQASVVFPFIMVSPAYFASAIQLGGLMQTANAFGQVQGALSVFVSLYRNLAEWSAVIERLSGFDKSVAAARAVAVTPPVIGVAAGEAAAVSFKDLAVRLPNGVPLVNADDIAIRAGRAGAGQRPVRRRQVHAVPRARRHLAVRRRHHHGAEKRPADDPAAAAVFSDRAACRRGRLSGRARDIRRRPRRRADRRGRLAGLGVPHRGGGALEPHAVARRAAAARHRARAAACARLSVPGRGHRLARRAGRGRALSPAGAAAGRRDHRVDRPPLDARRVPPPPAGAQPRRRPLLGARGQPGAGGVAPPARFAQPPKAIGRRFPWEPPPVAAKEAGDWLI